jgi:hypothetical protein
MDVKEVPLDAEFDFASSTRKYNDSTSDEANREKKYSHNTLIIAV